MIDFDSLEKIVKQTLKDSKAGKTKIIKTTKELKQDLRELEKMLC